MPTALRGNALTLPAGDRRSIPAAAVRFWLHPPLDSCPSISPASEAGRVHVPSPRRPSAMRRRLRLITGLGLTSGGLIASPAWAQTSEARPGPADLQGWLAQLTALASDPTARQYTLYIAGGLTLLWLLRYALRLLRGIGGGAGSAPISTHRAARRAARRGEYAEAGRLYAAVEDWEAAAEAYERGQAFGDAAEVWERLSQPAKAARLYEQAGEWNRAAELYLRLGNSARAASLFQKGGQEIKAADIYGRTGELERASAIYVKYEVFERAAELANQMGQPARAAEWFERALGRLRLRQGGDLSREAGQAVQLMARRCAEAYARAGEPARAAAVLLEQGLEVEAADFYCRAGEWESGLRLFLRHQQYDRASAACQAGGAETWLHVVEGERLAAAGRDLEAAREFEAGQTWWRAAEMYDRAGQFAKAAELHARHGDEERAAELHAAAGNAAEAAATLERLGRWKEAARFYQEAGEVRAAARALQMAQEFFEAGTLLLQVEAMDEAVALLQQVGSDSDRYLDATTLLGDIFLERGLEGPAREKFEKALALRPMSPDFVHPAYQLATVLERQGDLTEALHLLERVLAERFDYQDAQARAAGLRVRLSQREAVPAGGDVTQVVTPARPARYRVARELGRGGMGIVYLAEDAVLQRSVAYKVVPASIREDPKTLDSFLREARIAASLQHPNIVTIYDAGQTTDEVYIAMEYVEGRSLQQILDESSNLSLGRALGIFRQACLGLIHAHGQNIVHRDVKPANMMITPAGVVKLMDFGLAAVVTQATARATSVRGTPFYMAPEQILGENISALSDQYSLGCTLYHMVTGRPPFVEGDVLYHHIHTDPVSPREVNPQIPVWLDAIILRTMLKSRTKRFPSVDVVLKEVESCLGQARSKPVPRDAPR